MNIKKSGGILFILLIHGVIASQTVGSIKITGLNRTAESVVLRELLFKEGDLLGSDQIEESLIRLRNTQLFSKVDIAREQAGDDMVEIRVTLEEKWTTIPIFKAGGGGGINYLTIGAYDINILGRYLELGGQYERLGATNSAVLWFRDPRFLNRRWRLGGDFWYLTRNQLLYDEQAKEAGGYTHQRNRAHLFFEVQKTPLYKGGVGVDLTHDSYSEDVLEQDTRDLNEELSQSMPRLTNFATLYVNGSLGRIKYENHLAEGLALDYKLSLGLPLDGGLSSYQKGEVTTRYFHRFPGRWGNPGVQLTLAESLSPDPHFRYYIGGLDAVRGYHHAQFLTRSYWLVNGEYRIESIRSDWFVLQHIFFVDVGNGGDGLYDSLSTDAPPFVGFGAGLRFISPRVYRLNIRLDYGFTAGKPGPGGISFGFQHFF